MIRAPEPRRMARRRKIVIAALILGLLLIRLVTLAANHVHQNHIVRECGAECGGPAAERGAQDGI